MDLSKIPEPSEEVAMSEDRKRKGIEVKICRNTWRADEGRCELILPDELSEENLKEVEYWIEGCLRRYRRAVERARMSVETIRDLMLAGF